MYTSFFGLTEHPFELRTDPRFLYLSPAHARARAYLYYAVVKRDSIVTITGEIGSGKSTLIEELCLNVERDCRIVVLHQTQLDDFELLQALLLNLGVADVPTTKAQTLDRIRSVLVEHHERGQKSILIVDDAQNLSSAAIEELRMLTDDECDGQRLLSLVLVGQADMSNTLSSDRLRQVRQRVRLNYHLDALNESDTGAYIDHRLSVAGCRRDDVFPAASVMMVFHYTGGIPRLINILCDMAMTAAAQQGSYQVTPRLVAQAIEELQWVDPAAPVGVAQVAQQWLARFVEQANGATRQLLGIRVSWADVTTRRVRPLRWLRANEQVRRLQIALAPVRKSLATHAKNLATVAENAIGSLDRAAKAAAKKPFDGDLRSAGRHALGSLYVARRPLAAAAAFVAALVLVASLQNKTPVPTLRVMAAKNAAPHAPVATNATAAFSDTVVEVLAAYNGEGKQVGPPKPQSVPGGSLRMSSSLQRTFTALPTTTVDIAIVPPAQIALSLPDANWLLGQAQDAYTIQILGTHSPKNLTRFIRSQGLDEGLAYYTIERKGKDWFVLVQGVYPDRATARLARAQLPEKVRANNPWIRRLDEVHEMIRTATPADRMLAARSGDIENSLLK